ncbi:odorant receptor 13a-like [Odontomachus brunneus]|uniref:odorant receptor 13a-like n=1 Tax=Odontomachus brunneus TaxID=486640 RepID=UPI0013F26BB1|nr:odorant receptor 13a-like [Odontomachus brunneus]
MASEQWNEDIAYAMTPLKLVMWPLGVWPLQVYNIYSLIRCVLTTCFMSIVVILPTIEFYLGCTDAEQNIYALMLTCCGMLAVTKMICVRIYATNFTKNYKSALNDYMLIENDEQRAIMHRHAFMGRALLYSTISIAYIDAVLYSLIPFLGNEYNNQTNITNKDIILEYTVPSRCTLKYLNVPDMHKMYCLIELISMLLTCTSNYGNDTLILHVALHICGQVKILKYKFMNFNVTGPKTNDRFNAIIERHSHLMAMTKILADGISFILLMQLFISSVFLCIAGFEFILALKVNDVNMILRSAMVLNAILAQITIYSFVGDYLKSQMEEIATYIYQSVWYDLPATLMKNLTFVIMRSQSPVQFQAGNFIVINFMTYMSILKTSVSYLSVLRVMVES